MWKNEFLPNLFQILDSGIQAVPALSNALSYYNQIESPYRPSFARIFFTLTILNLRRKNICFLLHQMKCTRCSSVLFYITFSCIWKKLKKGNIVPLTKHYLFQIDRLLVWSVLSIQYSNGLHIENTNYNVLSAIIRITYPFRSQFLYNSSI